MNDRDASVRGLSSLSDKELQGLVGDIANALGVAKGKAQGLDLKKVRTALETISDEEAKKLIERAGKDKAEEIYRAIQRRGR